MWLDEVVFEIIGYKLFVGLNWNFNLIYLLKWNYDGNLLVYMYDNDNNFLIDNLKVL